jgi:hypothetical protein
MFHFLNKQPLTFKMGFNDAKRHFNDLLDAGYCEDIAVDKLTYSYHNEPSMFPNGKNKADYLEGYREFLTLSMQARFTSVEPIPPNTDVDLACDLLEFLNGDAVTKPPSPTVDCIKSSCGYAKAETVYFNLLSRGLDIEEIYAHFKQNKDSLTDDFSVNNNFGFCYFMNEIIIPRYELEQALKLS